MSSTFVCSSQLSSISFGLPLSFFPGSRPSNMVLTKEPCCNRCPNHLFCLVFTVSMSSLLVSTVLSTSSFFLCSIQDICNRRCQIHISDASVLFMSLLCSVHVSLSYNAILHTNALTMHFFQLQAEGSTHEIFLLIESFFCQCIATSYFTFAFAVLGHDNSKITQLCDWLQFFTIDPYSQLAALPLWHSHKFVLFHIYLHVVFLWRLLEISKLFAFLVFNWYTTFASLPIQTTDRLVHLILFPLFIQIFHFLTSFCPPPFVWCPCHFT